MRSEWHNLPVINGVPQHNGREYHSSDVSVFKKKSSSGFSLDISGAYKKKSACRSWVRSYNISGSVLTVTDAYELETRNASDVGNFLVQGDVFLPGDTTPAGYTVKKGETVVCNGKVSMMITYPSSMTPSITVKELDDPRLTNVWGNSLRRISYTSPADAPAKGKYVYKIRQM